ncbi:MAG: rhamnulokinase [Clostridia bacterium]|nr:rhamnulokinase [Clostridia bacterium]
MNCYLAVDIGASGGRHIVGYVQDGCIRTQEVYRFENGAAIKNGHLCWDAERLFSQVIAGMKACCEQGFIPVSMGIDTWAVDFALLDKNGELVGDIVAYRDARTEGMDARLEKTMPFDELYRITGIAKQPFNTVYQMLAVLDEYPQYREQVKDFLLVPEYLSYRLTGKRAHEWTNVSTGALADAATHDWSPEVRKAADLPDSWFETPIVPPGTVLGTLKDEVRAEVGFDTTVILTATHDTGSAYMAVPARDQNAAFLSSGTWSLLGVELDHPVTGEGSLKAGFTNEGGWGYTTRYLKNIMGMWMLQCIRAETGKKHSYAEMAEMAEASDYPAWIDAADNRFLAPASMLDEVKAALGEQGAPQPQSLADVLRAVTLGLAVCYRDSIREMERLTGKAFTSVNIVGGGSQNLTLNRMTAKLTGLPVFAGPTEGTALGNLAAQMIADGVFSDIAAFRAALSDSFDIQIFQ